MNEQELMEINEAVDATRGKYLTVNLDDRLFGIPIRSVVQIVGVQEIVPVPDFPHYAKGVTNLRGNIIPVIDMRLRMGLMETEFTDRTCIIITSISDRSVGFIVDSVDEVTDIPDEQVLPTPQMSHNENAFVDGVCKQGDKIILRIKIDSMFDDGAITSFYP